MLGGAFGVVGLGVMGRNLALNLRDHGVAVTGLDPDAGARARAAADGLATVADRAALVAALPQPRRIIAMIPAGPLVDVEFDGLLPLLDPGDVVIDGGNAFWRDTVRRERRCAEAGVHFVGAGISGGEEGARHGPAIMVGGAEAAWRLVEPALTAIAARHEGRPCCGRMGPDGAGHFVKMVHNGIEYAIMQLLAEAHQLMGTALGLDGAAQADLLESWGRGRLESFLVDVTVTALRGVDAEDGLPLVPRIRGVAEQKGTGGWTAVTALELGVPAPCLIEAVQARSLSALGARRDAVAAGAAKPAPTQATALGAADVEGALYAASLLAYAQGLHVIGAQSAAAGWGIDGRAVAATWRAGCIVRARMLDLVAQAADSEPPIAAPAMLAAVAQARPALAAVVATGAALGVPLPVHGAALAYLDSFTTARLPANLIQAQRDIFGAHQFERIDRPGRFHHDWSRP